MSNKKIEILQCTTFRSRFLGLMFQKEIKKALCFPKCNSIHTFFMRVPIEVIITSKEHIVLYEKVIKPWRILWPVKYGYYTYEFPLTHFQSVSKGELFKGSY